MNKITDLVRDALQEEDYQFRINFLLAGLMSAESNDTSKKIAASNEYLKEIRDFILESTHDSDKQIFLNNTCSRINKYLDSPGH